MKYATIKLFQNIARLRPGFFALANFNRLFYRQTPVRR
nr:MAG TPA: hypothetical protein [Caudoviricetes sp.]